MIAESFRWSKPRPLRDSLSRSFLRSRLLAKVCDDLPLMALTATVYHLPVALSDVDRGVYETLDLRLARHPSETMRYLLLRLLAYCLLYEEGIAFSKGGLSSTDEAPISIRDRTGLLRAFVDIGFPSADRLHKAAKAAPRVILFSAVEAHLLQKEARERTIHRVEEIEVWRIEPTFLDALEPLVNRHTKIDLLRSDGVLYATVDGKTLETPLSRISLGA